MGRKAPADAISLTDAAKLVGVMRETFRGWHKRGLVKLSNVPADESGTRWGYKVQISRAECERIMAARTVPPGMIPTGTAAEKVGCDPESLPRMARESGVREWRPWPVGKSTPCFYDAEGIDRMALTRQQVERRGKGPQDVPPGQAEPSFWQEPPPVAVSGVMVAWWCAEELPRRRAKLAARK